MRRFEYMGGGSSKFWEIGREGAVVTVSFGRIGTAGQTQVKELSSEADAISHLDRLVAEKVKKGYVESGAPATTGAASPPPAGPGLASPVAAGAGAPSAPAAPPPGARARPSPTEDTLTIPPAWRRTLHPRRGSANVPALALNRREVETVARGLLERSRTFIDRTLAHAQSEAGLVEAVRGALGEGGGELSGRRPAELTPLGAAALAALVERGLGWAEKSKVVALADLWVMDQGLTFAVTAAGLLGDVIVASESRSFVDGVPQACFLVRPTSGRSGWRWGDELILGRMRHHLAAAGDSEYAAAVEALRPLRSGPDAQRRALSFLVPSEAAWVEEDSLILQAGADFGTLLLASAATGAQLERIAAAVELWHVRRDPGLLYSLVEGVGGDAAPTIAGWFDRPNVDAEMQRRLLAALAVLPTDEAFDLLIERVDRRYVEPALIEAAGRFPARALRLLSRAAGRPGAAGRTVTEMLRGHVLSNPELVALLAPQLDPQQRQAVDAVTDRSSALPAADPAGLPAVLVQPPWASSRTPPRPVVVDDLEPPTEARIDWAPGERDRWRARRGWGGVFYVAGRGGRQVRTEDWDLLLGRYLAGELTYHDLDFFALAPPELVRPHLAALRPRHLWSAGPWIERIVGIHELEALPVAVYAATASPTTLASLLLPFESTEIAMQMADWYVRLKSVRSVALAWLRRHPGAARGLVPAAVGRPGRARKDAEAALRALSQLGHREAVLQAASGYGQAARSAVETVLDTDPLDVVPPRIPTPPSWTDPALLPQIALAAGSAALPQDSVRHVCTMLAISKPGDIYPGVEVVKRTCDRASLAEFAWALFEKWQSAGMPPREAWAFDGLGVLGDDETVRRLSPLIRAWPGEGGHARAVTGLEILASIGSDVALMHLNGIAEKVKFKGLRTKASEKIEEVARDLDLTPEELADRLVPELGLDADGSLTLDYGSRRFVVGFDEQLRPYVADEGGTRRKDLPAPGGRDDATLAPEARRRFAALKKDVRTIAADQVRRLERAMVLQRRWSAAQLRSLFIDHPLLWHICRRLVWAAFDGRGAVTASFRVAEDRTLADIEDLELELPDDAIVGIAHPLHLGDSVRRWSDLFADYEILQPFAQLGRDVHHLTAAEKGADVLSRFKGLKVETARVLGLERFGWERGEALDAGIQGWMQRRVRDDRTAVVELDPGIIAGSATEWKEQTLADVWLNDAPSVDYRGQGGRLKFGVLDDVTASELVRDLTSLVS